MSCLGDGMDDFKESSSSTKSHLKMRVKVGQHEFAAYGNGHEVTQQFQKFLDLIAELDKRPCDHPNPVESKEVTSELDRSLHASQTRSSLQQVFENDHRSSVLLYRFPPHREETQANIILMLLVGYQELRQMPEVPATILNQALAGSSLKISRLDRVLKSYIRERFVVKRGRGKGGYYRLTGLGTHKATERIHEYLALFPPSGVRIR